jgi:protein-arginine kinase activator protein McsA
MRCDNCGERDAVINLTQVEHDTKVTLRLCEECRKIAAARCQPP